MTEHRPANESQVTLRAVASQLLFRAGHSLTTGGFFYYFVNEFNPSGRTLALLQVAPETAETLGGLGRWLIGKCGSKKWLWVTFVLLARMAALLIPLALLLRDTRFADWSLTFIFLCTLLWYGSQGIAFVTYVSWLADLVPRQRWGKFFARWSIASLVVAIAAPNVVAQLRKAFLQGLPAEWEAWSYGIIFTMGGAIVMASTLPMLGLPESATGKVAPSTSDRFSEPDASVGLVKVFASRNFRWFILHYWWLSFFQGLTQSVTFLFESKVLGIPVATYYLMSGAMLLLQIPLSLIGGWLSDRGRDWEVVFFGLIVVSGAMVCYLLATPAAWGWILGAYLLRGLFGAVNVCEQNLTLKLAPAGDNAMHLSVTRQWGGAFAAAAGLLGGWWLDAMIGGPVTPGTSLHYFQSIFVLSLIGRATASLWLLGIKRPSRTVMAKQSAEMTS